MNKERTQSTLILWLLVALLYADTGAELGDACVSDAECGSGVCDSTRKTRICAVGHSDSCTDNTDKCVLNAVCSGDTCACKSGYTATDKLCIGALGSVCELSTGCGENDVCDTNANSATCALVSGGTCDASDLKCMTYSECTAAKCTCTNGDADETTKLCPAPSSELGDACVTDADCGSGVCDSTRKTRICAVGHSDACTDNADKCVLNAECSSGNCACKSDYTATDKLCIGALGSACETSTGCGENDVCDTNANSATCALVSGEKCDAAESKCMTYSECTAEKCTCTNGDADDTTQLCPASSSGFRGTFSMLVVTVCLWLSLF